jgi:4-amino-4-deoxy-L-arabinose transferase-like glycosyltransferase
MSEAKAPYGAVTALIRRRPRVLLLLLCLVAWLPGFFTIPPLDRDESRFAQASKQMLETGNFVDIRFGVEPRYKKPVGIYWLQAASTAVVGTVTGDGRRDHIWTYRIPSLIGASVAVMLTFWCATAFLSTEGAFLSALLLGLTLLLCAESKIAKTDAVLLATVAGAQGVLLRAYLSRDRDHPPLTRTLALLGWASFAIGLLIKGPVIFGVCGATALFLTLLDSDWPWMGRALVATVLLSVVASALFRDVLIIVAPWAVMLVLGAIYGEWRWLGRLQPLWGVPLTLLIVLPWFVAIAVQSHGVFYEQSLGHDFGAKLAGGQESHGQPPGYYLLLTIASFWPATLFLIPAVAAAVIGHRQPAARFLLAWAAATFLLFEIVPTKLPNYILPAYPALAMIAGAFAAAASENNQSQWQRLLPKMSAIYFMAGAAILVAAAVLLPGYYGTGTTLDLVAAAAVPAALAIAAAFAAWRGTNGIAAALATATALALYAVLTLDTAPRLDQFTLSPREAVMVARHMRPGDPAPVLAGYTEPSALFLIGTSTHLTDGYGAAEIGAAQGGLVAVQDGQRSAFLAHLAELEGDAAALDGVSGFNYSRGRPVHITLYRVTPPHEITVPPQE